MKGTTLRSMVGVLSAAVLTGALLAGSAWGAGITITARENLNVMNSDQATATSLLSGAMPWMIGSCDNMMDTTGDNVLTLDLGAIRNILKVELGHTPFGGGYSITGATVRTSNDNATWTPQGSTFSSPGAGTTRMMTLGAAVDARYVEITPTGYDQVDKRWIMDQARVFGAPGTLVTDNHLDLVSSTAFPGGVTLATNGSVSWTTSTLATHISDTELPIERRTLWQMGTGEGYTLAFGAPMRMETFGFMTTNGNTDLTMDFQVETSPTGLAGSWTQVLNQTASLSLYQNFFALTPTDAQYLQFTILSSVSTSNYIGDIFVLGSQVPEPTALALLGLGGLTLLRRRRVA